MPDKMDDISRLRVDMYCAPERPEFATAVGGYNRVEVNKFIDEQLRNNEAMKRVFYEQTNELRDELSLLAEENKRLRVAMDEIAPIATASARDNATGAPDQRRLVEQVAGILKARHEAELAARDNRLAAMTRALDEARADLSKTNALLSGREAQIDGLNRTLAQKEARIGELARANVNALSGMEAQLEDMRRAHKGALAQKDAQLEELARANGPALTEMQAALDRMRDENAAALAAKSAELEALQKEIGNRDERLDSYARVLAGSDARTAELNAALAEKKQEIADLTDTIEQKNAVIAAFNAELTVMRDDVRDACAAVGMAKERIDTLEDELARRKNGPGPEEIARKDSEIGALTDQLARRESEARRGEEEIGRLNALLDEKENELARLRNAINDIARIKKQLDGEPDGKSDPAAAHREREVCKIIAPNFSSGTTR